MNDIARVGPSQIAAESVSRSRIVTSYDVAKHAGVSQSAVSRYFTPGASVSDRMKVRIKKAAEELRYRPNAIARMLITKRSNLVAVIVANLGVNPEFTAVISREMTARGLNLLFYTLDSERDADGALDQLWQYRVDGVLSAAELSADQMELLRDRGLPLVLLNRQSDGAGANSVCCDQVEGERWLVERLVAAGHRRFAIVAGPADSVVSRLRVSGATEQLQSYGLPAPALAHGAFTYEGGRAAMRQLVAGGGRPDAVICANDLMAIGCIDEARHGLNLLVPDDLSVVGFDGSAPGRWLAYDLTTISQPTRLMVTAAVDMLVERIEEPTRSTERRTFSGEPVTGGSARLG